MGDGAWRVFQGVNTISVQWEVMGAGLSGMLEIEKSGLTTFSVWGCVSVTDKQVGSYAFSGLRNCIEEILYFNLDSTKRRNKLSHLLIQRERVADHPDRKNSKVSVEWFAILY